MKVYHLEKGDGEMNKNIQFTIKDVAKKAGVSVSTVSKVFNNYNDIGEKTKAKVLKAAEELNYIPDVVARSLVKNESKRVGILIEDYKEDSSSRLFAFDIMMGFKRYAADHHYEVVLLSTTTEKQKRVPLSKIIASKHIDGVFILGLKLSDPYFSEVKQEDFPCVLFDIPIKRKRAGSIGIDNLKGALLATEHLLELGHQKIALINGHGDAYVSKERLNGYLLALTRHDIPVDKDMIVESDFTENGGKKAMEDILQNHASVTAVFVASDLMAIGAVKYLQSIGKKVPEDISIVGFDDIESASHISPALTTIRQNRYELGRSAAVLLLNLISGQNLSNIMLEPELIVRESTTAP